MRKELIDIIVNERKMQIERQEKRPVTKNSILYKSLVGEAERILDNYYKSIYDECRGKFLDEIKFVIGGALTQSEKKIEQIIINNNNNQESIQNTKQIIDFDVNIILKEDLPNLQRYFGLFKEEVSELDEDLKNRLKEIYEHLLAITSSSEKSKINSAIKKLSNFLIDLNKKGSEFYKIISTAEKGAKYIQEVCKIYNKFAQWLDLKSVSDIFS